MNRMDTVSELRGILSEIDSRIGALRQQREVIESAIRYAEEPAEPKYEDVWVVESRSMGPPHYVSVTGPKDGRCTCAAAHNGNKCWALKGVLKAYATRRPSDATITIYSDNEFDSVKKRERIAWRLAK